MLYLNQGTQISPSSKNHGAQLKHNGSVSQLQCIILICWFSFETRSGLLYATHAALEIFSFRVIGLYRHARVLILIIKGINGALGIPRKGISTKISFGFLTLPSIWSLRWMATASQRGVLAFWHMEEERSHTLANIKILRMAESQPWYMSLILLHSSGLMPFTFENCC